MGDGGKQNSNSLSPGEDEKRSEAVTDHELMERRRRVEFALLNKSSIRLPELDVVEFVEKLHVLWIIDFDLLHMVFVREHITASVMSLSISSLDFLSVLLSLWDKKRLSIKQLEETLERFSCVYL